MRSDLERRNATALIIGSGPILSVRLVTRLLKSPWPVLHDPERTVYRAFGLEKVFGLLQHSGTVVVDAAGTVRMSRGGLNPANAFSRNELLEALDAIDAPT